MAQTETLTDQDLFMGAPLPGADLVIGQDFYDEPDPEDSSYRDMGDPLSVAVGTLGYVSNHILAPCFFTASDGATTEPEEFDRFYFPPDGDPSYDGPAPVLIDILLGDEPAQLQQERDDRHVEFKMQWCAEHDVRYVVLQDLEDLVLPPEQLRARIMGEDVPQALTTAETAAETTQARKAKRSRGVQRPRA